MKKEIPHVPGAADHDYNEQSWHDLGEGDYGAPVTVIQFKSAAVQVSGVPNGAAVGMFGRINKSAEFVQLEDFDGFPAQAKQSKLCRLPLDVVEIQPKVIGGNPETKLTVTIFCKR